MNREEMLARLANGEDPLKVTRQKWEDIANKVGTENGWTNCACCEVCRDQNKEGLTTPRFSCEICPIGKHYMFCGDSISAYMQYLNAKQLHGQYSKEALKWANQMINAIDMVIQKVVKNNK